jgi:hypothetical protein
MYRIQFLENYHHMWYLRFSCWRVLWCGFLEYDAMQFGRQVPTEQTTKHHILKDCNVTTIRSSSCLEFTKTYALNPFTYISHAKFLEPLFKDQFHYFPNCMQCNKLWECQKLNKHISLMGDLNRNINLKNLK